MGRMDELGDIPLSPRRTHGTPRSATSKLLKARWMANNPTPGESAFHLLLVALKVDAEFQIQAQLAGYIPDFYHPGLRTDGRLCKPFIVEIDGASHFTAAGKAADKKRTAVFSRMGIKVIRFTNSQVVRDRASVAKVVMEALNDTRPGLAR